MQRASSISALFWRSRKSAFFGSASFLSLVPEKVGALSTCRLPVLFTKNEPDKKSVTRQHVHVEQRQSGKKLRSWHQAEAMDRQLPRQPQLGQY